MGSQRPARTFPPLPICPSYCHTVQQSGRGSGQLCPGGHLKWRGAWRGGYTATPSPSEGPAPGEMDPCGRGKREDRPCWVLWCEERSCSLASLSTPQECRLLRNFSSVYAVVSALQSSPIHRLRAAWGEAARDSLKVFSSLCQIFSEEDNYSQSRELLLQVRPCSLVFPAIPASPAHPIAPCSVTTRR